MKDPQQLLNACLEYFRMVNENPLTSEKVGFSKGKVCRTTIEHPRAMTVWGLSSFLGITTPTWYEWRKNRKDLKDVIDFVEQTIKQQKFEAAAAGLLNANIISREMGLADKQIQEVNIPKMVFKPPDGEQPETPPIYGE